jgi:hypothetical protein
MMHGKWEIKGNTLCAEWNEWPNTGCIRYDKMGETVTAYDVKSGELRAKILETAPGNAENLAPNIKRPGCRFSHCLGSS